MRSRAALLPTPGDPYLLAYFLHFFKSVWYDEVDKLYIYYNSPIEDEVVRAVFHLTNDPKIKFTYIPHHTDHGPSIDAMLEQCEEEYVMLIEDDAVIFRQGAVNECFEYIEYGEYDIVGSPRGSCALEIIEKAKQVWGTDAHGPNFWPNFFFIKKEKLLLTDRNFAAKAWYRGDKVEPLHLTIEADVAFGDTFVNTSLQLRAMQLSIKLVEQYHLNIDDEDDALRGRNIFNGQARWLHVGSLSSGISGFLKDEYLRPLSLRWDSTRQPDQWINYCNNEQEKLELERRISFWSLAHIYGSNNELKGLMPSFEEAYSNAINRLIRHYNLDLKRINRRMNLYRRLGL